MKDNVYIYKPEEWTKENPPSQGELEKVLDFFWESNVYYRDYDKKNERNVRTL